MPFSRHALDYPINRLYLRVGIALQTWGRTVRTRPEERAEKEREIADLLDLPQAVEQGLLKRWKFIWTSSGFLEDIRLIPDPRVRRTPGLPQLKRIFFRHYFGP